MVIFVLDLFFSYFDFMFADKTLIDYTNMFSSHDFNKKDSIILVILKMYEKRSINYCNIDLYLIQRAQ